LPRSLPAPAILTDNPPQDMNAAAAAVVAAAAEAVAKASATGTLRSTNAPPRPVLTFMSDASLRLHGKKIDFEKITPEQLVELHACMLIGQAVIHQALEKEFETFYRRREKDRTRYTKQRLHRGSIKALVEEVIVNLPPNPEPKFVHAAIRDRYTEQQLVELVGSATIPRAAIRVNLARLRQRRAER
jgi:hypothetical protein